MCGIAGIVGLDGSPVDRGDIERMTAALAHRGPDGQGIHCDKNVALGHRRLSIIDLSTASSQPMFSEDGMLALTFNGEIYNFQEKRELLKQKGYIFHSTGDTEVLLKLYEEFGPSCLDHLRGQFAFAILDRKKNSLFLARDRAGKKPIKYFYNQNIFAFASELKALRTLPDCPREPDLEAIHHFLTMMYVPSPGTGFIGIHKLSAGHCMTIDLQTGDRKIEQYWELNYETDTTTSLPEWKEKIWACLEEATRLRMIADVPVGAFLSGGLDSATVVAMMSKLSPHPVKTFSIGSPEETHNELPQAALIAKQFGTDHHPITLEADIVHLFPELVRSYEEPYADPSVIPTYLVAREARKEVTVALNGDGGDENFGGYLRYPILLFSEKWRRMPGFVHALTRAGTNVFHHFRNDTLSYRARRFQHTIQEPLEERYLQYLSFFTEEEKRSIERTGFGDQFPRTASWYAQYTARARSKAHDPLHQAMSMDLVSYLADDLLPKVDIGTMAHSLEARSPLLDHVLLELTAGLPAHYQVRGKITKWIMKDMVKDLLPQEILTKKKTGFRLPLNAWFRGDLKEFVREKLLSRSPLFDAMFDYAQLEAFWNNYLSSSVDYSDHLWALLWLKEWDTQYLQSSE